MHKIEPDWRGTQNQRILYSLLRGLSLTQRDALRNYGCARLASRIGELKKDGWMIDGEPVHGLNQFDKPYTIKRYFITKQESQSEMSLTSEGGQ